MEKDASTLKLILMTFFYIATGIAQLPDIPIRYPDSAANLTEDLIEQQPDEDEYPDAPRLEDFEFTLSLRARILHRMQPAAGYSNGYYSGSADKIYDRLVYRIGEHVTGGLLMEKDPGESKIWSFTTMNISFLDVCPAVKKLVLGDYRIESGQGLLLWSGRGFTKGADVVSPLRRRSRGIVSALSSDEFHFFRGLSTEISWQSLNAVLFLSSLRRSAVLDDGGNIVAFNENGYYRTANELQRFNNTGEIMAGGRFVCRFPSLQGILGLTLLHAKYSREFTAYGNAQNVNGAAADISFGVQQISFCGEMTHANNRSAGIAGAFIHPDKDFKIVMSFRFYPNGYLPVRTLPFGEWGTGERGFYCGATATPWKSTILSLYFDQFEKITEKDFSYEGNDLLINGKFSLFAKLTVTVQYRRKVSEYLLYSDDPGMLPVRSTGLNCRQKFRLTAEYKVSPYLSLRGRIEFNFFSDGIETKDERGFLFYHDITVKTPKYWMFSVRISNFRSHTRETVPYELERDLEGVLTQTMLAGEGIRFYLLVGYDAADWLKISGKYSVVRRDDVIRIGNGNDQLPSNRDTRISVQFDMLLR